MFDEKSILARLQNGEDAGAIANQFADMLNKSIAAVQEQAKRNKIENMKDNLAEVMADAMFEYIELDRPELAKMIAAEDVDLGGIMRQSMESAMDLIDALFDIAAYDEYEDCSAADCDTCGASADRDDTAKTEAPTVNATFTETKNGKTTILTGEDAINQFLKTFGLK